MNRQPAAYLQTDPRWSAFPYQTTGERATIGGSGCGPTCAAMVLHSLTGRPCTPVDTCKWSVDHGYKARGQGTYYGYFRAQFAAHGIPCRQLLGSRLTDKPKHPVHDQVKREVQAGFYAIALMGPGLWTRGGHFVLVWDWDDGAVYIHDPASTKTSRRRGDPQRFRREVRNYWLIDARDYNRGEDEMTQEQFDRMLENWLERQGELSTSDWAREGLARAVAAGITDGTRPRALVTRQEAALMAAAAQK